MGFVVYYVGVDRDMSTALTRTLFPGTHSFQSYPSLHQFLAGHETNTPGCLLLDLDFLGLSGLSFQETLRADGCKRPIIFLSREGEVSDSVRAMKGGAINFLVKPVSDADLLAAIKEARHAQARLFSDQESAARCANELKELTRREFEVFLRVAAGKPNKEIAYEFGTAVKTVKVHRNRVMTKLGVRHVAALVRLALRAEAFGLIRRPNDATPSDVRVSAQS